MAFSGTISETIFNTGRVITHSFRRCKLPAAQITSENLDTARGLLYLLLSELSNKGIQLWCIENLLIPLYEGNGTITLPLGTVDILNASRRVLTFVSGTDTDTSTAHSVEFDDETAVTCVGIAWSAASQPLLFERSDDGVTWTTIQSEVDPEAVADEVTWLDLDTSVAALFFRVSVTSGTFGFNEVMLGNNPSETTLGRLNRDQYTNLPNKSFQSSQVQQYWYDRQVPQPLMRLNPVPNAQAAQNLITLWRQRHVMDVGTLTEELNIPQRWYMAVVTMLARQLAREIETVDAKIIPQLDADAAEALRTAQEEERDNSPVMIAPNISMYTR